MFYLRTKVVKKKKNHLPYEKVSLGGEWIESNFSVLMRKVI